MKKIIISFVIPFVLLGYILFQTGCVKEEFDTIPIIKDTSNLVASLTIAELKAITDTNNVKKAYSLITPTLLQTIKDRNTANGVQDIESLVIEGYVTTSDSAANFYEAITIQDETAGIDIKINSSDLYSLYRLKPGQKVMVKLNDLYLGYYRGTYQIGIAIVELGLNKIAGIPSTQVYNYIERTGWRKKVTPETITIGDITLNHYQKLVRFDNIQFKVPAHKFSDLGENSSRTLIDCDGKIIFLRTSGFSKFADSIVPSGKGSIVGVLTRYVGSDKKSHLDQLTIRDLNDISFNEPQCSFNVPTPNTTIADLKAMCTGSSKDIVGNVVISGVVCANDETGNVYKQLILNDATGGISFSINITGMYPEFPIGTRMVVNCDGLTIGKYGNQVQLGMKPYSSFVSRLDPNTFYSKIFVTGHNESVTPIMTSIKSINDDMLYKVITLEDVQIITSDLGKTWSDPFATSNRYVEDFYGNKLLIRTSSYATFANIILPPFRGNFSAVLTKYFNDYQLLVRDLNDIDLKNPRYSMILSQDFNSASLGSTITIGGWKSKYTSGTKNWICMSSVVNGTTQYYAELNANNSGETNNVSWLVSPQVDLTGKESPKLFFQTAFNNWAGNGTLQVFISTNYNGTDVDAATWTAIPNATIATQSDGATNWVESGMIDLSQYNSTVYLGFKYTSAGGGSATTYRIDNVKIF